LAEEQGSDTKLVLIGDKSKSVFQRTYGSDIVLSFNNIGKKPPTFLDAGYIAENILNLDMKFDIGNMYYNVFKSVISYKTSILPFFTNETLRQAKNMNVYDSVDDDVLQSYNEFLLLSSTYFCLKEAACSEQSSRMTAMDAASKNAGEMIDKLTLTFNRTRQAVITRELIEIISGAAAL
jgi:F-type H+-transporting ATPase subunit gamma